MKILSDIFVYPGYSFVGSLSERQANTIEKIVVKQIDKICHKTHLSKFSDELKNNLSHYHETSFGKHQHHLLTKAHRLFAKKDLEVVKQAVLSFDNLSIFGGAKITNEEKRLGEEIYWRIVRPNEKGVGNIHADKWFWDLGVGQCDPIMERVKIWVGLIHDRNCGGLEFAPGSHLLNYPYGFSDDGNKKRPFLDIPSTQVPEFKNIGNIRGVIAAFNDRILHRGVVSKFNTRVSFEFTLEFPRSDISDAVLKNFLAA